jgi:hypothetical protein
MRGVPRARRAISREPPASHDTFRMFAERATIFVSCSTV